MATFRVGYELTSGLVMDLVFVKRKVILTWQPKASMDRQPQT